MVGPSWCAGAKHQCAPRVPPSCETVHRRHHADQGSALTGRNRMPTPSLRNEKVRGSNPLSSTKSPGQGDARHPVTGGRRGKSALIRTYGPDQGYPSGFLALFAPVASEVVRRRSGQSPSRRSLCREPLQPGDDPLRDIAPERRPSARTQQLAQRHARPSHRSRCNPHRCGARGDACRVHPGLLCRRLGSVDALVLWPRARPAARGTGCGLRLPDRACRPGRLVVDHRTGMRGARAPAPPPRPARSHRP